MLYLVNKNFSPILMEQLTNSYQPEISMVLNGSPPAPGGVRRSREEV